MTRAVFPFIVQAVANGPDLAAFHRLEGNKAMERHDYAAALSHYRTVAQLTGEGQGGVADALIHLGRYKEAVTVLEPAMGRVRGLSRVPDLLALAYVALGRDNQAEALLRRSLSPAAAAERVAHLRERARRLPTPR